MQMAVTQYIGARYVPVFADPAEWTNTKQYEPLTIVLHQGNSFTSKQFVPIGVDIDDTNYWAETGNYNAQVEAYRQEVGRFSDSIQEKPFAFDTVAEMQESSQLYVGAICHTNGFHESGDGGAAWYVISESGNIDNVFTIAINNNLVASIVDRQQYSAESLGFVADGVTDNAPVAAIAFSKPIEIRFNSGVYCFSETSIDTNGVSIIGNKNDFPYVMNTFNAESIIHNNSTFFAPATRGQEYIIRLGDDVSNISLSNIVFTSIMPRFGYELVNVDYALVLKRVRFSRFDRLSFIAIKGCGMHIISSWELVFSHIEVRAIKAVRDPNKCGVIEFDSFPEPTNNSSNITITSISAEQFYCNLIYANKNSYVCSTIIEAINCESGRLNNFGNTYIEGEAYGNAIPLGLISEDENVSELGITINAISYDNVGAYSFIDEHGAKYNHCAIITSPYDSSFSVAINTLAAHYVLQAARAYIGSNETFGLVKNLVIKNVIPSSSSSTNYLMRISGTLTSCEIDSIQAPIVTDGVVAAIFPYKYDAIKMVPLKQAGYKQGAVRRFVNSTDRGYPVLMTPNVNDSYVAGSETRKRLLLLSYQTYISGIIVVCEHSNTHLTLQLRDSSSILQTATISSNVGYDVYRLVPNGLTINSFACYEIIASDEGTNKIIYIGGV